MKVSAEPLSSTAALTGTAVVSKPKLPAKVKETWLAVMKEKTKEEVTTDVCARLSLQGSYMILKVDPFGALCQALARLDRESTGEAQDLEEELNEVVDLLNRVEVAPDDLLARANISSKVRSVIEEIHDRFENESEIPFRRVIRYIEKSL